MACINTFGSFTCDCGDGKQYDVTTKTCIGKWAHPRIFLHNVIDWWVLRDAWCEYDVLRDAWCAMWVWSVTWCVIWCESLTYKCTKCRDALCVMGVEALAYICVACCQRCVMEGVNIYLCYMLPIGLMRNNAICSKFTTKPWLVPSRLFCLSSVEGNWVKLKTEGIMGPSGAPAPRASHVNINRRDWETTGDESAPSLFFATYFYPSTPFTQFSRGYSFSLCCFKNSFMMKFTCLHFRSEDGGQNSQSDVNMHKGYWGRNLNLWCVTRDARA